MEFNGALISMLALLLIIGFGYFLYNEQKKLPHLTIGDIINAILIKQRVGIYIFTIAAISIGEALTAATITPVDQVEINAIARVIQHMSISFMGFLPAISLPIYIERIKSSKTTSQKISSVLIMLLGLACIVIFPAYNLFLAANAVKQVDILTLCLQKTFGVIDTEYLLAIGKPEGYSPFQELQYVLAACLITFYVHILVVILDMLEILGKYEKPAEPKDAKKNGGKPDGAPNKDAKPKPAEPDDDKLPDDTGSNSTLALSDVKAILFKNTSYNEADKDKFAKMVLQKIMSIGTDANTQPVNNVMLTLSQFAKKWDDKIIAANAADKLTLQKEYTTALKGMLAHGPTHNPPGLGISIKDP